MQRVERLHSLSESKLMRPPRHDRHVFAEPCLCLTLLPPNLKRLQRQDPVALTQDEGMFAKVLLCPSPHFLPTRTLRGKCHSTHFIDTDTRAAGANVACVAQETGPCFLSTVSALRSDSSPWGASGLAQGRKTLDNNLTRKEASTDPDRVWAGEEPAVLVETRGGSGWREHSLGK